MSEQLGMDKPVSHRATYILEFGTWRATCRVCGYSVTSPQRRQAAAQFRGHIRDFRVIDLTDLSAEAQPSIFLSPLVESETTESLSLRRPISR
jgi:hypothetical protein